MSIRKVAYYAAALLIILLVISYFTSGFKEFITAILTWIVSMLTLAIIWAVNKALGESQRLSEENRRIRVEDREENRRIREEDREENRLIRAEDREKNRLIRAEERMYELRQYSLNTVHSWAQQAWNFVKEDFPIRYRAELVQIWSTAINLSLLAIDIKEFGSLFSEDFVERIKLATEDFNLYVATLLDINKKSETETLSANDIAHIDEVRLTSSGSIVNLLSSISGLKAQFRL